MVSNWTQLVGKDGRNVYFNKVTGVSQFVKPDVALQDLGSNWDVLWGSDGRKVYFNNTTGTSQFVKPDSLARQEEEQERLKEAVASRRSASPRGDSFFEALSFSNAGAILEFTDITRALNPNLDEFKRAAATSSRAMSDSASKLQLPYLSSSSIVQSGPEGRKIYHQLGWIEEWTDNGFKRYFHPATNRSQHVKPPEIARLEEARERGREDLPCTPRLEDIYAYNSARERGLEDLPCTPRLECPDIPRK